MSIDSQETESMKNERKSKSIRKLSKIYDQYNIAIFKAKLFLAWWCFYAYIAYFTEYINITNVVGVRPTHPSPQKNHT
jgi:hypothetical protein